MDTSHSGGGKRLRLEFLFYNFLCCQSEGSVEAREMSLHNGYFTFRRRRVSRSTRNVTAQWILHIPGEVKD
ncbi:hypothetical protein J6590_063079 [Homalodisca vitripennis]|nr:hypothetical protein J6590_063079 [Homalodisca vitripennis]